MPRLATILIMLSIAAAAWEGKADDAWIESTYDDFCDGTFDDAGANTYVSAAGRIQTINRWDVNRDGHIDLLFVNSHPLIEMLDLSIYWGNGKDFSIRNHSYVPVNGPMWVTPGDLNDDGRLDLVVANYSNGTWTSMDSAIYWAEETDQSHTGNQSDVRYRKRTYLPSQNCQKAAIADFNRDGLPDIVFAFSGGFWEYRGKDADGAPSRIYWNHPDGFSASRFTDVLTRGASDVATADLDKDGHPDLVFSNADKNAPSYVYYGTPEGFSDKRLTELPANKPHAVEISDVNGDGELDLLFANEAGAISVAYLGDAGRFDESRRIEFPTHAAKDCVVADFNRDGHADVFFTNHQHSLTGNPRLANRLINSYLYWGSSEGFSPDRRNELPTIGAWGASAADLNQDGWTDLVVCNFQEHYSYEVPSFVYWNGPDGFSVTRRTPLYEHGAQGCSIADLNGDGHLDIAVTSMMAGSRGDYDPCWLYYGNAQGQYSPERRITLPGREGYEQAMADLDDDGQVDVLLMNQGEVTRWANELCIYWNEGGDFHPWRVSGLPAYRGLAVQVSDLDKDGFIDVIISNYAPETVLAGRDFPDPTPEEMIPGTAIYWGSREGYVVTDRTSVPIIRSRAPCIADMNQDGHLDLVFGQERENKQSAATAAIFYGDGSRNYSLERRTLIPGAEDTGTPDVADLDQDGLLDIAFAGNNQVKVYYGQADGTFTVDRRQVLDLQAKTMTIADVNDDGWLDLICPLYKQKGNRSLKSSLLLGAPEGFSLERRVLLPTDGGTGAIVSDFNRDGRTDVFFWCHRRDGSHERVGQFGDHDTDSFLYFGRPQGFGEEARLGIPGKGVHYDVGADIGHIRDRTFSYAYVSSPRATNGMRAARLAWQAETPAQTAVRLQLRWADQPDLLNEADWQGPDGPDSYFTGTADLSDQLPHGKWIQYRAELDTDNGAESPRARSSAD